MAILKCKMCGGDFEVNTESNILECEYCGTKQTIPNVDNEKKVNLFNRANRLRINCEFDKAATIYENIISEFPEEAEAYWGLCLCNYGIEYVDDPATAKKIPTCHRASFESLQKDENYALALEYSDVMAQKVYRDEAREIDRIMNEILAVSKSEKPYDVFICYKESDEHGNRTVDSVLAYDIYEALTAKGYNVFFSRVTLEDKLGRQYEPYIFAALNSAKVMLSIGTKYEYFNAVWVKNEWSRFLKLMAKDRTKLLIPCYKDMDPYDMPDEFKGLQAQDMGKLGAMQDLLRGVEKILPKNNSVQTTKETVVVHQQTSNATVESLLKRAFMFLEDGDWTSANEYCEKVLDLDPECAQAYLGKLMADLKVKKQDKLKDCSDPFDKNNNYNKILRFGDEDLKQELLGYIDFINYRNGEARKESIYQNAQLKLEENTEGSCQKASKLFSSISGYKDAEKMKTVALNKLEEVRKRNIYQRAHAEYRKNTEASCKKASELFLSISGYKNADEMVNVALQKAEKLATKQAEQNEQKIKNKARIRELITAMPGVLSAGRKQIVGLKSDGTVVAADYGEDNEYCKDQCDVEKWCDIVAVSAGGNHIVGLKDDGTVVAVGKNYYGQCCVYSWNDIIAVSAGENYTVGLKDNGTVIATDFNGDRFYYKGQCDVRKWRDIVSVAAGNSHTVGLKSDGTVVAVGSNVYTASNESFWSDIVAVTAGDYHTVGLKSDGTVVAVGDNKGSQCDVEKWRNIIAVAAGSFHTIGLKHNGTVVAVGSNEFGECNVEQWHDIVAIAAGGYNTVGLKADGTVVMVGDNNEYDVKRWRLLDNVNFLEKRYDIIMEVNKKAKIKSQRCSQGLCQHCGGTFKGLLTKKCTNCGKPKDY